MRRHAACALLCGLASCAGRAPSSSQVRPLDAERTQSAAESASVDRPPLTRVDAGGVGACGPPYPRPGCRAPLGERWTGVWVSPAGGDTILVDRCGVYTPPPWISDRGEPLWRSDAPVFRWSIESATETELILAIRQRRSTIRLNSDATEILFTSGRTSRTLVRRQERTCHWIERAEFGIEVVTDEDAEWLGEL